MEMRTNPDISADLSAYLVLHGMKSGNSVQFLYLAVQVLGVAVIFA